MKMLVAASIVLSSVLLSGCASFGNRLVLDRVGPSPRQPVITGSHDPQGALVVFSAFDVGISSVARRQFSNYKILLEDGTLLKKVVNDNNGLIRGSPTQVELPEGKYRIVADSNGYGVVTVPVLITASRVTTVYLAARPSSVEEEELRQADPVRLPDGAIVGWRAKK